VPEESKDGTSEHHKVSSGEIKELDDTEDKVFVIRNFVEVRIPRERYEKLLRKYRKEYIISLGEPRRVLNHITGRDLVFVTKESGIPLLGNAAFGLIDRGTNLIQVRPVTGCNLKCIFCSVDEGKNSRTRATDYVVEPEYLAEWLRKIAEFKGSGVEAHIDGQGEPLLYPYMNELLEQISDIKEVETISMQTNGILLSDKKIDFLERHISRINLSLSSLNPETADILSGVKYPVKRVIENAEKITQSKMDLLIAPVWVPDYNDHEIEKIIQFALDIGAGKKYPPLGIQKYIPYKFGRKLKKTISFKDFYRKLEEWEKEYGVKLILKPEDFGMHKRKRYPAPIKKGDKYVAMVVAEGRMRGEMLAVVKNRVVTVRTDLKPGKFVKFQIVRAKDGIFLGEEI